MAEELFVEESGAGAPVVLIHGVPSAPRHFGALAKCLADDYRVLTVHLPGYGRSPRAPVMGLAERHASIVRALQRRHALGAHYVTFSAGSLRVLSLALDAQLEPRSIFALAGVCELSPEERAGFLQFADAIDQGSSLAHLGASRFLSDAFTHEPDAVGEVQSWFTSTDSATFATELRELANEQEDLTSRLGALRMPIVARHGSEDVAVPIAHGERLARAAARGQLQRVEGKAHALLLEDFADTLAALRAHLRGAADR